MTTGIEIPQISSYTGPALVEEQQLMEPLVNRSILRSTGIYPINTIARPEDLKHYFWKIVEDLNLNYSMEPYDSPTGHLGLQNVNTDLPVISGKMHFGTDEMRRMNRTKMSADQRILRSANFIALREEQIAFSGSTENGLSVYAPSDTTNAATAASTELNCTTLALLNSTLNGLIDQLWDNGIDPAAQPLKLVTTGDVFKVIKGLKDTVSGLTGLELVRQILNSQGGAGSNIHRSKYFTSTVTKNAKKTNTASPTQGTTNAALFAVNQEYYEIVASPIEFRYGNPDAIKGMDVQFLERWLPLYKTTKAIIYSGTAVIA